jgi:hypothetical protein
VIKQDVGRELQDQLFEHTRMLKERKTRDQRKDQTEVMSQNGEDITSANRTRVSRVQETKRETVDIHDLVHSFDDLFPISGHGLAA